MLLPVQSARDLAPTYRAPLTRAMYERMVEAGVFTEDDKVELLYGVLVEMSPEGRDHVHSLMYLTRSLTMRLNDRAVVRVQLPLAVSDDSVPEPDFAVIPLDHDPEDPLRGLLLAIEVAKTSVSKDRNVKRQLYAEAGISEYWLVDLNARHVEVYRDPSAQGYRTEVMVKAGETITLSTTPNVTIPVDEFPPPER